MVEHAIHPRDEPAKERPRTDMADLIAELTTQIDNIRRMFDGSRTLQATSPGKDADADIVFIDDLAHCMGCSWAKRPSNIDPQPDANAVAQCRALLDTTLQVLSRIETMPASGRIAQPSTDV